MTTVDRPVERREADALVASVEQLRRFVAVAGPYLPESTLEPARALVRRAGERLALSREHTVVALVGATGSGKSSLFNRLAGADLSPVGVRRPTTPGPLACVWGQGDASELLDWLGVPAGRRFGPVEDEALAGLVLLDLPDFDSVETAHRVEVDRLLELVDVMVWVLDPEKYADRLVHRGYLSRFSHHRDITVVILNQADRLGPGDVQRCLDDLRRLVGADGLAGVPVVAASTVGAPGIGPVRDLVGDAVAARRAALRRLAADLDGLAADLDGLVADEPGRTDVDRDDARRLTDALAGAAGVPMVARATGRAYVHRARRSTGWPLLRWLRRLRPDPLSRLRLGGRLAGAGEPVAATSVPPAAPAALAAVGLALRTLGERAAAGLPEAWRAAVLAAARSRSDDLPDALDVAVARTDLGLGRRPVWWRAVGAVQWLLVAVGALGLAWLVVRYAMFALALPEPPIPRVGAVPLPTLMFGGGLLGGLLLAAVLRPVVAVAAGRKASRAARRLREAVAGTAGAMVLEPVRDVLRAHAEARAAVRSLRSPRGRSR